MRAGSSFAVLLVGGWLCSLAAASGESQRAQDQRLIDNACSVQRDRWDERLCTVKLGRQPGRHRDLDLAGNVTTVFLSCQAVELR